MKSSFYRKFDHAFYTTGAYDDYLEQFVHESRRVIVPSFLRCLSPDGRWKFLDVGCGMGGNIIVLRELGYEAYGVEVSPYCVEHSLVEAYIKRGECFNIPFPDYSFEVILCFSVFQYLTKAEVEKSIAEFVRVAKRYIVFSTIDKDARNCSQEYNPDDLRLDATLLYSADEYIRLFEHAGCTVVAKNILPTEDYDFSAVFRCPSPRE